ncbi:MAG: SOS response-associated peptidase, partial [Anaerolineales bacterium]|nr:SOS response-associated peptidase [Anaerolineales bacterium]
QPVAVIPNNNKNQVEFFQWGLIPFWAKDAKIGYRMINARSETLAEKPAFRTAYRRRRCLVLASGFYEWKSIKGQKTKVPYYIQLKNREPFAMAGLWEVWNSPDGSVIPSCTIITTRPNELVEPIHNRMPVILPSEAYELWLDPAEKKAADLDSLLQPMSSKEMAAYPVSILVNSPNNDTPECIMPVE